MKIPYFPGCTLTNKAKGLNEMAKQSLKVFDLELAELKNWYCCQANFSLLSDNLMNHLAPIRTLICAKKEGEELAVLCSTCYYVLKRINYLLEHDEAKRKVVFDFLEEEYYGPIKIIHFLELAKDKIGFSQLKDKVKINLQNLKLAAYYGCQLLRPKKEIAFDSPDTPAIFEEFLKALGAETIDYPFKTECCGAFLFTHTEAIEECVLRILTQAIRNGAEAITTSCPLCNFNLDWAQKKILAKNKEFKNIPVFYLTEIFALSLGIEIPEQIWDEHIIDVRPFLAEKGCL